MIISLEPCLSLSPSLIETGLNVSTTMPTHLYFFGKVADNDNLLNKYSYVSGIELKDRIAAI